MPTPAPTAKAALSKGSNHTSLAALCLIARHHGIHLATEQLRRDYAVEAAEPTTAVIIKMAGDAGLVSRRSRLSWRQLLRLGNAVPVMLRMKGGQTMVLTGVLAEHQPPVVLLRDPLGGDGATLPVDEIRLREIWSGEVVFFKRRFGDREQDRPFDFLWIFSAVMREARIFRDAGISSLILSIFTLAPVMIFIVVLDKVLTHQRMSTLALMGGLVGFIIVFDTLFGFMRRYLVAIGTARIDARLNEFIFDRLINLPMDFFEKNPTGVVSYKISEIWRVRNFLTGQLFTVLLDSMTLLILIPAMFILSPMLTFMVLGIALLMTLVVFVYLAPMARAYSRVVAAEQAKGQFLVESIHGMRTIKSLSLEGRKRRDWDARAAEAVRAHLNMQHVSNQPQTILHPLEKFIYMGTLLVGAYLIVSGAAPAFAGLLVAFSMIASRATAPFVQIAQLLQQVQEVRGAVAQVASVVNHPPERAKGVRGVRPDLVGAIEFSEVRFQYPGSASYALDGMSLSVPAGSMVGIMGRSGSGKTTVTRLLQGLNREYQGLIKIDDVDLREIDLDHLRSNLGVVLQDNFLFKGSIRENIMAARTDASLEDVIGCARLAGAEEFIERLPRGYETMIEEGSANLSGGQRQRIAIARALLVNPPIIILDEATSALDPDSEAIVNASLQRIREGRTVIVISHRLTSLIDCDPIVVMERGTVVDCGKHDDLLQRCDIYRHMWYKQNRHLVSGVNHDRAVIASPHVR